MLNTAAVKSQVNILFFLVIIKQAGNLEPNRTELFTRSRLETQESEEVTASKYPM